MDKLQILRNGIKKSTPKISVTSKDALTYLYKCFRIAGVHATKNNRYAYYIYGFIINGLVTLFLPIAFIASYTLGYNTDLDYDTLFNSIQVFISIMGSAVKVWMLIILIPKLISAEKVLAKLDERCISPDEVELLHNVKKLGRKLVIGFTLTYWSYSSSTFITSVAAGHPPYSIYLPFINWRHSTLKFCVACSIEFFLEDFCCFQTVATDSYAVVYVCILRAHLNILRLRIRKLGSNAEQTLKYNFEDLKLCIIDHKNIIQLHEMISPVISTTIFLQFTITAAVLGTTLINILLFASNYLSIVASLFYVLAVVVQIFPLCYYSNCLYFDSNELSNEIFHSPWIQQSPRYRQMLIFFMQRSQRTMILMAGKIFPINLNSFVSIAKLSFSCYTLIKKIATKERLGLE